MRSQRIKRMILLLVAGIGFALPQATFAQNTDSAPQMVALASQGGKEITVSPPAGTCALDPNNLYDAQVIAELQRANRNIAELVLAFTDCKDLDAMHHGKPSYTGYYGDIVAPFSLRDAPSRAEAVKAAMAADTRLGLRKTTEAAIAPQLRFITTHPIMAGSLKTFGILRSDEDAIQVATFQIRRLPDLSTQPVLGLSFTTAFTVPVVINFYRVSADSSMFSAMDEYAQSYMQTLNHMNKVSFMGKYRKWLLLLGALLIAGAVLYFFLPRTRRPVR